MFIFICLPNAVVLFFFDRYVALFLLKLIMIVWFLAFLIMVGVTLFKSLYRKFQPSLHYLFDTTSSPVSVITRG